MCIPIPVIINTPVSFPFFFCYFKYYNVKLAFVLPYLNTFLHSSFMSRLSNAWVWAYFSEQDSIAPKYPTQCKLCHMTLLYTRKNGFRNLIKHLARAHNVAPEQTIPKAITYPTNQLNSGLQALSCSEISRRDNYPQTKPTVHFKDANEVGIKNLESQENPMISSPVNRPLPQLVFSEPVKKRKSNSIFSSSANNSIFSDHDKSAGSSFTADCSGPLADQNKMAYSLSYYPYCNDQSTPTPKRRREENSDLRAELGPLKEASQRLEKELRAQKQMLVNIQQQFARMSNSFRESGIQIPYELLPFIDGTSPTCVSLPLLHNIFDVLRCTNSEMENIMKRYGLEVDFQGTSKDKIRKQNAIRLAKFIGCSQAEQYWNNLV